MKWVLHGRQANCWSVGVLSNAGKETIWLHSDYSHYYPYGGVSDERARRVLQVRKMIPRVIA
tara:strand:+ start:454 stop:639 length:186 start_codon:yes stop_codon:yes gene_type:complete